MSIPLKGLYLDQLKSPGQIANNDPATFLRGFAAEENIPFGDGVGLGTDDEVQSVVFGSATGVFLGVAAYSDYAAGIDDTPPRYRTNDGVDIVDRGLVVVRTTEAVDPTDSVHLFHTGASKGKFAGNASAGNTVTLTGASWAGKYASGVAVLKLNGGFATTADV
jgi:hypothetical protein